MADNDPDLKSLTADIVAAHVSNNSVAATEVGALITSVYGALSRLGAPEAAPEFVRPRGAVTARKSLASPSRIISMIDGKPYAMLRRHISQHGYTPESYRAAFGLPRDYPMTAPEYAEKRRALAKKIGLGRKPEARAPTKAAAKSKGAPRGRTPRSTTPPAGK